MNEIKISELKTNETISNLIPEMTEKEYLDLKTNIEHEGIHHAIDINADNTILDGRHRVRVCKSLGIETIKFNRHDLNRSEAIKFVRDTAVERRHLTPEQRTHIILNSEEVIAEISERAKESKEAGVIAGGKARHSAQGSVEPQAKNEPTLKPPTNTNEELGKLAGVSKSTVVRAKKLRRENPEGYERAVKGESTFSGEYNKLPSVKKPEPKKEVVDDVPVKAPSKPKREPVDLRNVINDNAASGEEIMMLRAESDANHLIELCGEINNLFASVKDSSLFERLVSTLDTKKIEEAKTKLEKIINGGI